MLLNGFQTRLKNGNWELGELVVVFVGLEVLKWIDCSGSRLRRYQIDKMSSELVCRFLRHR